MKKIILTSILYLLLIQTYAQQMFVDDSLLQQKFNFQVKQLSQFFDRFNFKEQMLLNFNKGFSREKNLVSLINIKDSSLLYNPETIDFLRTAGNEVFPTYIYYTDSNWYAIAHASFLYKGQKKQVDIILQPEGVAHNGYAWVIIGARGELFNLYKEHRQKAFINPMNHDIGFTELSQALADKKKITSYTSVSYQSDNLATFLFLVRDGDLQFIQINSLEYQFFQVPGWVFSVKDFNRADVSSGWLISSVLKIDDKDKKYYKIHSLLN